MARKVEVVLVDDIDGSPASQTVSFSLDGRALEIDLCDANAEALTEILQPYIARGRKVGARSGSRTGARTRRRN